VRGTTGSWIVAVLVAGGVVAAEARPLHFAHGGERRTFTFCEGPLVVGLVVGSGLLLVLGFTVGIVLTQLVRRLPVAKVLFNVAQYAAAASVAVLVSLHVSGIPGVVCALVAFALVNEIAVKLVLRITAGTPLGIPFGDRALIWFLHMAGATSVAIVAGRAVDRDGVLALAFVAPIVLVTYSQRETMKHHVAAQVLQAIAEQAVASQSTHRQTMTALMTRTAREVMAAGRAELLLLDGPCPLHVQDVGGEIQERRIGDDWYNSDEWFRATLARGSTGATRSRWAGVVIGSEAAPRALLAVMRQPREEPFRNGDLQALQVLAGQATTWLENVDAEQGSKVIDLDGGRAGQQSPRVVELLIELDLLRSRLDKLTATSGRRVPLGELEESRRRLTDALSDVLGTDVALGDDAVAVGRWNPVLRAEPV
jgi:hypothetical protein